MRLVNGWAVLIVVGLVHKMVGADHLAMAIQSTNEVWLSWTNPPAKFDLQYAGDLRATNWVTFLSKRDTNPLPVVSIQVVEPRDKQFWRLVAR